MDSEADPPKSITIRHKCSACYKQYKKKEHLIEHMKSSYHSVHQPKCGVCGKHCKSFESVREHITGPLPKENCAKIYFERGCSLCLKIFDSPHALKEHREVCYLPTPLPLGSIRSRFAEINISGSSHKNDAGGFPEAVALDCEMVGGGNDGSLDICARVCLIDEDENVIFHTYVEPQFPVTDYRYDVTGIKAEHLIVGMSLKEAEAKVMEYLANGESLGRLRLDGGRARLLVGHDLDHDMDCLRMNYPDHLLRDTAKYRPLMKTNLISHSLKYLTETYLGYEIQSGAHDPYEDCVSAMRLYKRMRALDHPPEPIGKGATNRYTLSFTSGFDLWKTTELMKMNPDVLYDISRSSYRCWCLDSRPFSEEPMEDEPNVVEWEPWPVRPPPINFI